MEKTKDYIVDRNRNLDIVKGLLAVLVVLGHCIQYYYPETYTKNYFFNFIYGFHMPLFVMTSGYAAAYSNIMKDGWLKKRFFRLVVPFLAWAFLVYFITHYPTDWDFIGAVKSFIMITVINPSNGGLAFIWWIFVESVILWTIKHACARTTDPERWEKIVIIAMMAVMTLLWIYGVSIYYFGIRYVIFYFDYFFGGYLLNKYVKYRNKILAIVFSTGGGGALFICNEVL